FILTLCFIFLILLRSPISTLFPYTTLFRSYNYERDNFDRIAAKEVSETFLNLLSRGDHIRAVNFSHKQYNWSMDGGTGTLLRTRSEEHTSELQSRENLVCRLLLEKKKVRVR